MDNSHSSDYKNKDEIEQHKVKPIPPTNDSNGNGLGGCLLASIFVVLLLVLVVGSMIIAEKVGAGILWICFILGGFFLLGLFFMLFELQKRILDIIVLCIGICLLAGSGILYYKTQSFLGDSVLTEGIVINYENPSGDDETYYAVIEFKAENGDIIRFYDRYFNNPAIGDKVKVVYNSMNPSQAKIHTWFTLWSWPVVTFCIGVSATVIATFRLSRLRVKRAI